MEQTVDGVQEDLSAEGDVDAAPDEAGQDDAALTVNGQQAGFHQVVVGDIPLEPPGFQPRASVLAKLDRAGARVSVIHTTTGLQGRGATQLAAAHARAKLAAGWRLVAWVNAADTGSLQAGLAAVAEAMGLTEDGSGAPVADAGQAVRDLLETDGDHCLLEFDDVADPEALSPFVPDSGSAQVLIVSTRHTAPDTAAIAADVFGSNEALSFLAGRTGLDDDTGAAEVAAVLGHLPLALALAAPLIRGQRHGYASYLVRLQTIPAEVSLSGDDGQPYPQGVARAVLLSLAAIRAADKSGTCSRVMAIMSVLSAAGVPREVLHVAGRAGVLASGGRRIPADLVDQVLEWLSDQSLLTFPYYLFHPLAAERLARDFPDVRIIVALRDPVERAYSHFKERTHHGGETLSFENALAAEEDRLRGEAERIVAEPGYLSVEHENHSYLAQGRYLDMLPRWFSLFPREQFYIAVSEEFYADPDRHVNEVWKFLGLPPRRLQSRVRHNYLPSAGMAPQTRLGLQESLIEHNRGLADLLGRPLPWPAAAESIR